MAKFNFTIKRLRGVDVTIEYQGKEYTFYGIDKAKDVEKQVIKLLEANFSKEVERYQATKRRTPSYKELSRRKRIDRTYLEREIRELTSKAYIAASGGAVAGYVRTLDSIAEELLGSEMALSKFNMYSGNLHNSYQASVFTNGQLTKIVTPNPPKTGSMDYGPKGARYFLLQGKPRHPIHPKSAKNKRYPKKSEKNPSDIGYRDIGFVNQRFKIKGKGSKSRSGRAMIGGWQDTSASRNSPASRNNLIRSGIVIENTAPYADAVNLRYRVLKFAQARNIASKYDAKGHSLIRVATQKVIKAAGFSIKRAKK